MKQIGIRLTSLFFTVALMIFSVASVNADDTETSKESKSTGLTINDKANIEVGKTVSYTFYLSEATEPVEGFELRLFYDSEYLKYKKNSLKFEKFDVVFFNENIEGKIPMNYTSISNMPSFEKKTQFLTADFEVLKEGSAIISYFFTELYGENMDYLKSYKLTYDLTVDGKDVVKDAVPIVNTDPDTLAKNQGDFINFSDGMGEENSPQSENHVRIGTGVKTNVVDVTKNSSDSDSSGNGFFRIIIVLMFVLLVSGAIVLAVITVRKNNKSEE